MFPGFIDTTTLHHLDDRQLADMGIARRPGIGPTQDYGYIDGNRAPTRQRRSLLSALRARLLL